MKETVIITGGAGFILSHVADHVLAAGYNCAVIDDLSGGFTENVPKGVKFYETSILDRIKLNRIFAYHLPKFVIHGAAYAAEGLSPFIRNFNCRNNVEGSENVITECINHNVECMVFTSSIATYGDQTPPFTEDTPLKPIDPYGAAKAYTEASLRNARDLHGLNSVVFRPYNVIGERQNTGDPYRNVAAIFLTKCMNGEPMPIFGDGNQTRGFSHVSDVAPAIAASIDRPGCWNQAFNIGGARHYSVNELASYVAQVVGVEKKVVHHPVRHEAVSAWCDNSRAESVFGDLMPQVPIHIALQKMYDWVKENGIRTSKPFTDIEITKNLPPSWRTQA